MNSPLMKSLLVIALRQVAPLLGGAALTSDDQINQVAGAIVLLASVAYHVWQRHQGQQARG